MPDDDGLWTVEEWVERLKEIIDAPVPSEPAGEESENDQG